MELQFGKWNVDIDTKFGAKLYEERQMEERTTDELEVYEKGILLEVEVMLGRSKRILQGNLRM